MKTGDLVTQDTEKAEAFNATFAPAFTSKSDLQESQRPGRKAGARKTDTGWQRIWPRNAQANWTYVKPKVHPRTGEAPEDWTKADVTPILKEGKEKDPGNYRPVSLTSIPGKVMEQPMLETISKQTKDKKIIK
ncbi:mitochondrial enolase superfamily member 1 [Grus japonensis]|uniref:Mitochondrial enolase superfamily member 1 n=1 Tax=Grus japonensis TaxID=30415 RepID=A0ABC9W0V7_GRUJA